MVFTWDFLHLYSQVLKKDANGSVVPEQDIAAGIRYLKDALNPSARSLTSDTSQAVDYSTATNRCAYIFKNAPFHAGLTYSVMSKMLAFDARPFLRVQPTFQSPLKLVSLGGGPGSDVIGAAAALCDVLGVFPVAVKVVDIATAWEQEVDKAFSEVRWGAHDYGSLKRQMRYPYFSWSFVAADLLQPMASAVKSSIQLADLVTMVKFLSSAACKKAREMLLRIFQSVRPGGLVLSIENAGGGLAEWVRVAAVECGFRPVYEVWCLNYRNDAFRVEGYGYETNYFTTVTVQLLVKLDPVQLYDESLFRHMANYDNTYLHEW